MFVHLARVLLFFDFRRKFFNINIFMNTKEFLMESEGNKRVPRYNNISEF